jgi:hypothetical protein
MTASPSAAVSAGPVSLVVRSIHAMADGDRGRALRTPAR